VFGREPEELSRAGFPRRQTRLAAQVIARSHGLAPERTVFVRQSSRAVDAGAFHNDVVAVANESVLFAHEEAFTDSGTLHRSLPDWVRLIEVPSSAVSLEDAISSYLFNSQLVTTPEGSMMLVAPGEVAEIASTAAYVEALVAADNPIVEVQIVDLRQSMRNGGGPACVRLRVVLTDDELRALTGRLVVDDDLLDALEAWVDRHYRDELRPEDLVDPALVAETHGALDELTGILDLPGLYPFQR
jgi:succinylarginine dihydrolase